MSATSKYGQNATTKPAQKTKMMIVIAISTMIYTLNKLIGIWQQQDYFSQLFCEKRRSGEPVHREREAGKVGKGMDKRAIRNKYISKIYSRI